MMDDGLIRIATAGDRGDVVAALTSAFATDPVMGWLTRSDPLDTARLRLFFEAIVDGEFQKDAAATYVAEGSSGAAIWRDVGDKGPSNTEILKSAPTFLRVFRSGLGRTLRAVSAIESAHPKEPHVYLFYVGVHRDSRGQGLGTALLAPVLERCDREGIPAYLENSNPPNEAFYSRLGFVQRGTINLPKGAPPLTPMWREPLNA
jgi:GNAT superfamily N-acetyltransferase